jgi:multidrug efflux pump
MGIAVIGGLIFSTFLTLFIVPAVYSYFSRKTAAVSNVTELDYVPGKEEEVLVNN